VETARRGSSPGMRLPTDSRPKLMHVNRCGLCGGDPITRCLHKDWRLRLMAMVSPPS
jgi:hypothetical protein